jgi:negative regulator of flagellin synthesis FlgM
MRIDGAPYVVNLASPPAVPKESGAAEAAQGLKAPGRVLSFDRVEISSKARELQSLKQDLAALPDLRLDRVALAKQSLQTGGYRVEPSVLAQKMMEAFGT